MLRFRRYEAAPALQGYIHGYWFVQAGKEHEVLDLIPDGHPELAFFLKSGAKFGFGEKWSQLPSAGLFGQLSRRTFVCLAPGDQVVNIKLYPWTPYLLFGVPSNELVDGVTDIGALTKDHTFQHLLGMISNMEDRPTIAASLDDFFLKKMNELHPASPFVEFAVRQIFKTSGTITMDELTSNIHASRRYVEKVFKKHIGMAPKQYARLIRVKKASLKLLDAAFCGRVNSVAAELGYYDQSHFLKDFKAVAGRTPSSFLHEKGNLPLDHVGAYLKQWDYS